MLNMEVLGDKSFALRPPRYVDNVVLSANTPATVTVPSTASHVIFACTENFYAEYINDADLVSSSANFITNGTFASDTGWTKGTGWTISGGKADAAGAISTALSQTAAIELVEGRTYALTFTTSSVSAGSVAATLGGGTAGASISGNSTQTQYIKAGSSQTIAFTGTGFTGKIDDVTIAPVAVVPAASVSTGGGVELNPTVRIVTDVHQISVISGSNAVLTLAYYK